MSIKTMRWVGLTVLLVTVLLGGIFLPALYPAHDFSAASATRNRTMKYLAYAHLFTGALAGFGIALLVWHFRSAESTGKEDSAPSPLPPRLCVLRTVISKLSERRISRIVKRDGADGSTFPAISFFYVAAGLWTRWCSAPIPGISH
jgi:hypothetical protein